MLLPDENHATTTKHTVGFLQAGIDDNVVLTVRDIETIRNEMKNRIGEYQKKLAKQNELIGKTQEENKKLQSLIQELTEAKNSSAATDKYAALKLLPGLNQDKTETQGDIEGTKRKSELRKELLAGLDLIAEDSEILDNDDTGRNRTESLLARFAARVGTATSVLDPFRRDLSFISSRYGSGVSSVFSLLKSACLLCLIYTIIWGSILIKIRLEYAETSMLDVSGGLPTWTLYSQYPQSSAVIYTNSLIICMIISTISALYKTISDHKQAVHHLFNQTKHHQFTSTLTSLWDYTIIEPTHAADKRHSVAAQFAQLLADDQLQQRIRSRTTKDNIILWSRRCIGLLLNLVCLCASWIAIIYLTVEKDGLFPMLPASVQSLAAPIATSIIGTLLPTITFALTDFERWDDPGTLVKHQVWRLYAGRQLNILINVISYFSMAKQKAVIDILKKPASYDSKFQCGADAAGAGMFYLVLSEFFVSKAVNLLVFIGKKLIRQKHSPYSISESIIEILYFQSLIWVSLPLYPAGSVMSVAFIFANFKFEKVKITTLRSAPTEISSTTDDTSRFLNITYNITLMTCLSSYIYFLNTSWTCSDKGPYQNTPQNIPLNSLSQFASSYQSLSVIYDVMTAGLLYLVIAVILLILWRFSQIKLKAVELALNANNMDHSREINSLLGEIDKKNKIIAAQRRAVTLA